MILGRPYRGLLLILRANENLNVRDNERNEVQRMFGVKGRAGKMDSRWENLLQKLPGQLDWLDCVRRPLFVTMTTATTRSRAELVWEWRASTMLRLLTSSIFLILFIPASRVTF